MWKPKVNISRFSASQSGVQKALHITQPLQPFNQYNTLSTLAYSIHSAHPLTAHTHKHTHTPPAGVKSHALNYCTFTPGKKPRANCLRLDQTTVWINCLSLSYFLFFNVSVRAFLIFICSLSPSVLPSFITFLFPLFLLLVRPVLSLHWHLVPRLFLFILV